MVNASNFVSLLYKTKIVSPDEWPAPKILDEMYTRGYHTAVFIKPTYGVEAPPMMSLDECMKWVGLFRLLEVKRLGG